MNEEDERKLYERKFPWLDPLIWSAAGGIMGWIACLGWHGQL